MRIIIAGGRDFDDYKMLRDEVGNIIPLDFRQTLYCGMAQGADMFGHHLATVHNWEIVECHADWKKHGRSAGPKRNQHMAVRAEVLFAFWDGESKGTKDMINRALAEGLEVHVFRYSK